MSRLPLTALALTGLIMAGIGMWLMFPQIEEIGGEAGVPGVPYIALVLAGLVVGALLAFLHRAVGKAMKRYLLNMGLGFLIWGVIGSAVGIFTGDGHLLERALGGRIIGLWFSALFVIICALPGILGCFSALTGSRASMASTVAIMMSMSVAAMVYSEARYNILLDQNIPECIVTVVGLILFVEGLGMLRREEEYKEGHAGGRVLGRNVAFLSVFLVIASVIAAIPFLVEPGMFGIYEGRTIFGRAAIGLAMLLPLAVLAFARRRS